MLFYNELAPYYDKWVSNDAQVTTLTHFYSEYLSTIDAQTSIIYLGIATGRIALEITKNSSSPIIGIDISKPMLHQCLQNFKNAHLDTRLTLLHQDIRSLHVTSIDNIFILPFRTMVHFISHEEKKALLSSIYNVMKKNETFIFDLDILDVTQAKENNNQPHLSYYDEASGEIFYNQFNFDFEKKRIDVTVYKAIKVGDKLENLTQHHYQSSWIDVEDMRAIIQEVGFTITHSSFENMHQIWIVQK